MSAPAVIRDLVRRFEANLDEYRSAAYNEAQVRIEFIDPFFEALGWDVNNKRGYAGSYKDVIHEAMIKIGGTTKAPDYSFGIGRDRKFFVEAKKPAVRIREDIGSAFQLRRYAWTSKLPLSILTDFEELAVYDGHVQPRSTDKASVGRLMIFDFREYVTRWDDIADVFSRDAVLKGQFDRYAESATAKKGTAEVDEAFLEDIEGWRKLLAENVALRNKSLSQGEINFAVQRIIDRIIFLRICEDRGIELEGRLSILQNGGRCYPRLCEYFQRADQRYNSGLFHFKREKGRTEAPDDLTLGLEIDDRVIKAIVDDLYYPKSPYEFSVLSADILGQVYEQFLGKVIRLTPTHQARIEEKPEVKRAGGVFYTPTHVVEYIVRSTIGKLVEGKTPKDVAKLRLIDPACGSGSFLIGAYQFLLDWHRDYYLARGAGKHRKELYQVVGDEWRLATTERRRILLNSIFGVDIDPQAVEVTKLSLLLKVLEGENDQSISRQLKIFHERALPDLGRNIKCGNSLMEPALGQLPRLAEADETELERINGFDWAAEFPEIMGAGGFDAVIGNPPYDVLEKERGASSWPHWALAEYVRTRPEFEPALGGKLNLFRFFIVRTLSLARTGGRWGMIVPLALLGDISCAGTRRHLMLAAQDVQADCFPQKDNAARRIFKRAKLSTVVVTCARVKGPPARSGGIHVRVFPWNSFEDKSRECDVRLADAQLLDPDNLPIPLVDQRQWQLCLKVHRHPRVRLLGRVPDFEISRGEINQTVYREFIVARKAARMLKGAEIGPFYVQDPRQGEREWFDEKTFLQNHRNKPIVDRRRIATQRITGVDERLRLVATLIEPPCYFADSTNSIALGDGSRYSLSYLLGLLNSELFQWRFKLTSTNNNVGTNELAALPFRCISFEEPGDVEQCEQLAALADRMALGYQQLASQSAQKQQATRRQIDATAHEINRIVYALYDLDDRAVAVIREAIGSGQATERFFREGSG